MTSLLTEPTAAHEGLELPAWLRDLKEAGAAAAASLGLPTTKLESWRFTDLRAIDGIDFAMPAAHQHALSAADLQRFAIEDLEVARAVFVDGAFSESLSDLSGVGPAQVLLLSDAVRQREGDLRDKLGSLMLAPEDGLEALNQSRMDDGIVIIVPDDAVIERPLEILSVCTGQGEPVAWHPRHVIVAGKRSQVRVLEHSVSLTDDAVGLTNSVTEVFADEEAKVEHYFLERDSRSSFNISTLATRQESGSDVHSHTVLLGGRLVRNNVQPTLNGSKAHCLINGLYVGDGEQLLDNAMRVRHAAPDCESRQHYKGIMNGKSRGIFTGRIIVDKAGQQTDAVQSSRAMLLSESARATARPQLEIYADDVKCTHGATTGRVDDDAVFYFMSRGLSEEVARAMLIYAFAAEGFDRMELVPVRRLLAREMIAKLPKAAGLSIEV
ncbi:MAG: Fe-S cluster assembly protein SufD [Planctomycetota bacterium]